MKLTRSFLLVLVLLILGAPLHAQVPRPSAQSDSIQKPRLSAAQQALLQKLRQSHLTRDQLRQRLRDAGYDPTLADRYYDELTSPDTTTGVSRLSRVTQPLPAPSGALVDALRRIGVLAEDDSLPAEKQSVDTLKQRKPVTPLHAEPQVFGRELFAASSHFDAVTQGPVDPGYKLGPGDEVTLIITGDVEAAYDLQVTRDGYIVIPDIGQVIVNGLTLDQVKARLNDRLARVYSGVQAGTTNFDVSVGKLRSKLIYVIGEAEVPGGYQLPGSATVFNALFRAGGPGENGSFRNIQIKRGNKVVQTVDLYSYLLKGDKGSDIRLETGDVVFIPVVGKQVTVAGSVRRPAIFEMKDGETLSDVIAFAGGPEAQAAVERIQIDRILPPGQRQPGHERVLVDVALSDLLRGKQIPLDDGDRVRVSTISEARRNRVAVNGDVQRPGEYEYRPGMTVQDLIAAAQGLLPTAYTPTAHVVRLNPSDSSTSLVRVSLNDPNAADYASKVRLEDLDELVVFGRAKLANPKHIEIFGYVKNPGTYPFSQGMTVQDLVLLAGGFKEGAADGQAEVARRMYRPDGSDTLAIVKRVPLNLGVPAAMRESGDLFALADGDQVFIRKSPGYVPLSTAEIVGEVVYPGPYTLDSKSERVSDLVRRAGGLTREAYADGFRLFRDGKPVGVDLPRALEKPGRSDDMIVEPGDRLEVPRLDPTVLVTGAVQFESRVRYEKGLSVDDYLARAGGVRDDGNKGKVAVRYPNGELRTVRRTLFVNVSPKVEPGSTITVPVKAANSGTNWERIIGTTMTTLSGLATIILTVRAVR